MSDYMPKFYTLEDMTQEDLNKLALERNTYIKEIERLEALVECLYNKVVLNDEQEELLNKVLYGSDKE